MASNRNASKVFSSVFGVWLAVTACSTTAPTVTPFDIPGISGIYVLDKIDGNSLPIKLASENGCERTATIGSLHLDPAGVDFEPLYGWSIGVSISCTPVPSGVNQGYADFGAWGGTRTSLTFTSDKGRGSYTGTPSSVGTSPITVGINQDGHQYSFRLVRRSDAELGSVAVSVLDESGAWVNFAILSFVTGDGLISGGTTNNDRAFGTSGAAGSWTITVTPPSGYTVPSSQPNPVTINVSPKSDLKLTMTLHKLP
jgi:hypothetical protein